MGRGSFPLSPFSFPLGVLPASFCWPHPTTFCRGAFGSFAISQDFCCPRFGFVGKIPIDERTNRRSEVASGLSPRRLSRVVRAARREILPHGLPNRPAAHAGSSARRGCDAGRLHRPCEAIRKPPIPRIDRGLAPPDRDLRQFQRPPRPDETTQTRIGRRETRSDRSSRAE